MVPLQGRVIGTPGSFGGDKGHWYMSAFDGDPYTSLIITSRMAVGQELIWETCFGW